jgi:hypothetical protein
MWALVFVFGMWKSGNSGVTSFVVPNFKTEQACMIAQKALIDQTVRRNNHVHINMCVKGD